MSDIEKLLFLFFFIFVTINCLVYLVVYVHYKEKLYKELTYYWLLVLAVVLIEGLVTEGRLGLSLIFSLNLLPILLFTSIIIDSFKIKLNYIFFIGAMLIAVALAVVFDFFGYSFLIVSLPVTIATCLPAFYLTYIISFSEHKNQSDFIQKIISTVISPLIVFSCLHYSVRRDEEGTILVGFGIAFASYIVVSTALPLFAIRQLHINKNLELQDLVIEKTLELNDSKNHKEKLIRVLVHDISNSIQSLILQNTRITEHEDPVVQEISKSIGKNIESIIQMTKHVKMFESKKSKSLDLEAVDIKSCLNDLKILFAERFKHKNITLVFENTVSDSLLIYVDKTAFIHSVMANLMSNALKFSYSNSMVFLRVYEKNGKVVFDVQDTGVGIDETLLDSIFNDEKFAISCPGTAGEIGTGFGLPLVKNYTELFEGELEIYSSSLGPSSGTRIVVSLPALEIEKIN